MTISASHNRRWMLWGTAAAVPLFLFAAFVYHIAGGAGTALYEFRGETMGTTYHVRLVAALNAEQQKTIGEGIQQTLDDVDRRMSTYRPDSELMQWNARETEEPVALSAPLCEVFRCALQVSRETSGAFDVTVAPLVEAWGFDKRVVMEPPSPSVIEQLRQCVGFDKLQLDENACTLRKTNPKVTANLSAVAKGYAVDCVARMLENRGIHRYMVEVGGEVRTRGENAEGVPWRIAIETPKVDKRSVFCVISLQDAAMATSGNYRNFVEFAGKRYAHILDPRTAQPIQADPESVSVVHTSCMWADAYATALTVLGAEEGYRFACERQIAALFVISEEGRFTEKATPAFDALRRKSP